MTDYSELVAELRDWGTCQEEDFCCPSSACRRAADAIEELQRSLAQRTHQRDETYVEWESTLERATGAEAEYRRASGLAAELALRAAACDDWRERALAAEAKIATYDDAMCVGPYYEQAPYCCCHDIRAAVEALRGPAGPAAEGPFDQLKAAFDVVRREHAYPAEPADD